MVWTEILKYLAWGLCSASIIKRMMSGQDVGYFGVTLAIFIELSRQGLMLEAH